MNRLQKQYVRAEISSRLNTGMRVSYDVRVEVIDDSYSLVSDSGEVSVMFNPHEAEAMSADTSSISLLYGDNMLTVRYARKR